MGRPMGMNLIKAGYSLTVWNRTASRADELIAAGAKLAKSLEEVAVAPDFVPTLVSDPPALADVLPPNCSAIPALERGGDYVASITSSPALALNIAASAA